MERYLPGETQKHTFPPELAEFDLPNRSDHSLQRSRCDSKLCCQIC